MSTALATLTSNLAKTFNMGTGEGLAQILKATAFKSQTPPTDDQMTALLVVAQQYGLNPFTKEIYAFPDSRNGIVPVVGVDGWSRIINSNPQFDGMDFEQDAESCTCIIHRKDRGHPIRVTEFLAECRRDVAPWKSHPRRMLRHKAMIQCARLAFGFTGIFDDDEAERIKESNAPKRIDPETGEITAIVFDVHTALNAVEISIDEAALLVVWQTEGAKAVSAKDTAGHAALKAAVKERRAELAATLSGMEAITDVEAK